MERQVHRARGELVVSPPKTKACQRTVLLPPVLNVLKAYRTTPTSRWMFPSPVKEDSPMDPAAVRKRLSTVLKRADCKRLRFHDLRHPFATASLEHGMDVKTLSTIIGHVSSSTTLNIYAHVTDEMQRTAAAKIDRGIVKSEAAQEVDTVPRNPPPSTSPTRASAVSPAPAVSARSAKTSGKADTLPSSMESAWLGMYMPKHRKSVRKSWPS